MNSHWVGEQALKNIIAETRKLEVLYELLYNPIHKNEHLPIVGNLTFPPSLCNSNLFYFKTMNSFELPWDGRTSTSNIIPKKKNWMCRHKLLYNPTLENEHLAIVGNLTFFPPCVTVNHFILEL